MKTLYIIIKSLREQVRSFWVLLLTLSMGPFFIFIYYLITESSRPSYDVIILNLDKGLTVDGNTFNRGDELTRWFQEVIPVNAQAPFTVKPGFLRDSCLLMLKNRQADAMIIIDTAFTSVLELIRSGDSTSPANIEFAGDLTSTGYLISAVWANDILFRYIQSATGRELPLKVSETPVGSSGAKSDFDIMVPGILIVSLIMLMFTASIAFVAEVENRTMLRLKLSKIGIADFLMGNSIVQVMVGLISVLLTLAVAILLGFSYEGSLLIMLLIAGLTSLSIIAFSLIIAAVTKSASEVLVVGNFPMFLFMFFTGAAFPMHGNALFTIAGYPIGIQGLMTPTHAISALNKTLVMEMPLTGILPELIAIVLLTAFYFAIGAVIFRHRHLRLV